MATNLCDHPLVQHHLTILRDRTTNTRDFRLSCKGVSQVVILEAAKLLSLDTLEVETPLETTVGARLSRGIVFVPILRAGLGMLEHAMDIIPNSSVGYVGMEREEATAEASCYYAKMPELDSSTQVFVLDPMLATGGSAAQCVEQIKTYGAKRITMLCIIAAPEGLVAFEAAHPDVPVITGKIDRALNDQKYILPGLGDFGDRLYNS